MIKKRELIITCIVFMIVLSGCALIFKGQSAELRVNSVPSAATVFVNGMSKGNTPLVLSLARDRDHTIIFKRTGFEDLQVDITKKFDVGTAVVGNFFSWSVFGLVVDIATGAAYSLTPADIEASLYELITMGLVQEPEISDELIQVFMISSEDWEQIKTRTTQNQ